MAKLSVNVNKVATLRNTRPLDYPSPLHIAQLALSAGAAGITVHPRPDQRHIRPADVTAIADLLRGWPDREFNIEGNPFHGLLPLVMSARPAQVTLVPDSVGQSTSDHGFDLSGDTGPLTEAIAELRKSGARISLFMDADEGQIERAAVLGVDRVELYTEPYASAFAAGHLGVLDRYRRAADTARAAGLGINAGHDLTLDNLPALIRAIPFVDEVSIGHALIGDALQWGITETVRRYIVAAGQV
jgi:pyridoxine 5-phosphate synthase